MANPELYRSSDGGVLLFATRCRHCGHVAFPRQHYGCEKCGATTLEDAELPAVGALTSFATVHLHQSKSIAAPFVIGEVRLDAGPTVRITLLEATDERLRIGMRMQGALVESSSEPAVRELRFTQEPAR